MPVRPARLSLLHELAGYPARRAEDLSPSARRVQPGLQDDGRRRPVDHLSPLPPGHARLPQPALGLHGGETFVLQLDRDGQDRAERAGERLRLDGGRVRAPRSSTAGDRRRRASPRAPPPARPPPSGPPGAPVWIVPSGTAIRRSSSEIATPIRASPRSRPSTRPGRLVWPILLTGQELREARGDAGNRLLHRAAVRPAREPHDRLAARSPADLLRGDLEQLGAPSRHARPVACWTRRRSAPSHRWRNPGRRPPPPLPSSLPTTFCASARSSSGSTSSSAATNRTPSHIASPARRSDRRASRRRPDGSCRARSPAA